MKIKRWLLWWQWLTLLGGCISVLCLSLPTNASSAPIITTLTTPFSTPIEGMAVDNDGNVYVVANFVSIDLHNPGGGILYKINSHGQVSVFAGTGQLAGGLGYIQDAAVDSNSQVYVSAKTCERVLRVISSSSIASFAGQASTQPGSFNVGYGGDGGPATSALLFCPRGMAVDSNGNVYIADQYNFRIRKVDTNNLISTLAGDGSKDYVGGSGDGGPATSAQLADPTVVAVDRLGNVYLSDNTARVRRIDPHGIISTFAGNGTPGYSGDGGPATEAQISATVHVAADSLGNIYLADCGNNVIRRVDAHGIISTFAGSGNPGYSGDDGPATQAQLSCPTYVGVDSLDNIYVADSGNKVVRKIELNHAPTPLDDIVTTTQNVPVVISVLDNDSDVNSGDTLHVITVGAPLSGSATISGTAQIVYTPMPDFVGVDSFTYTVVDSGGLTATATVNLKVQAVNDPPTPTAPPTLTPIPPTATFVPTALPASLSIYFPLVSQFVPTATPTLR